MSKWHLYRVTDFFIITGFKSSQPCDGFRSSQRRTDNPAGMICGFCEEPGHHLYSCIKRGPCFWPDWHAKTVKQFNATHGSQPKKSAKNISMPPPPKPHFEPNLRAIQMMIDQVTRKLDKKMNDSTKGEALTHHAMEVCHV